MKIIINEIPLSKNKYVNIFWAKRREYKNNIRWLIFDQDKRKRNEKEPYKKATVTFSIFFRDKRKRDVANYLGGGLISWLDALVDLKFIADDSYDVIGQPNIIFNIDRDDPRTEIIIEEI